MKINALTDSQVRGAKAGIYVDGQNLLLRVSANLVKTWTYKYKNGAGKSTAIALGQYPRVGLAEARALKERCKELLDQGLSPRLALEAEKTDSFGDVARLFIAHHSKQIKYGEGMKLDIERHLLPSLGNMPIGDVRPHHVISAIQPVISRGSTVQAAKYAHRCKQIVGFAVNMGLLQHNALLTISKVLPKKKVVHQRALSPAELPLLVNGLRDAAISVVTREMAMFILRTAVRANEAASAKWEEIDWENRVWTIPASRMKMSVEHRIYLADGSIQILEKMREVRTNAFIFPGRDVAAHANPSSVAVALGRAKISSTTHGFRSLFSTYAHEKSDFGSDVIENALAHRIGGVRGAYLRSTFWSARRDLSIWWDAEVQKAGENRSN